MYDRSVSLLPVLRCQVCGAEAVLHRISVVDSEQRAPSSASGALVAGVFWCCSDCAEAVNLPLRHLAVVVPTPLPRYRRRELFWTRACEASADYMAQELASAKGGSSR